MVDRYFVIMSRGHSGSAWLAKVLNSHFDVMCFHELECITYGMPSRTRQYHEYSGDEKLRNLMYLFSPAHRYGATYRVLGTVDGALDVRKLQAELSGFSAELNHRTRLYILLRNPINQIQSWTAARLRVPAAERAKSLTAEFSSAATVLASLEPPLRGMLQSLLQIGSEDLQFFIYACLGYVKILWSARDLSESVSHQPLLYLERLTQEPEYLRACVREITGLEYNIPDGLLQKVNVKSGAQPAEAVFASWSEERQRLFQIIFERHARLLASAGYDLQTLIPSRAMPESAVSEISLRAARLQLARAAEELDELRRRYEETAQKASLVDGLGPTALKVTRGLKVVLRGCRRTSAAFDSLLRTPVRMLGLAAVRPDERRHAA
jgi:hypothetical protein